MKPSIPSSSFALALLLGTLTLVGCGGAVTFSNPKSTDSTPPPTPQSVLGPAINGAVFGGHAPIQGEHVYLLQPGTTGYGSLATSLLGNNGATSANGYTISTNEGADPSYVPVGAKYVTTDSNGAFSLTGAYYCTPGQPVYIYAWGGNIGGGALNNNNIVQLATLGNCPNNGSQGTDNFFTGGSALTYVYVNEVSTVAAAYTFQPFTVYSNNDAWHIGSSDTTQGLLGIANAAATAAQLYDIEGGTQLSTSHDGEGHVANYQTISGGVPNEGNGVVPEATIDSLANILADCVDSTVATVGTETSQCSALFSVATSNGEIGGPQPTDTGTAAINIARFPAGNHSAGTANVDATYVNDIFTLQNGTVPYVPDLNHAPYDWTIAINYPYAEVGGYGTSNTDVERAESIQVDQKGQIWITAQAGGDGSTNPSPTADRWSPLGVRNSTNQSSGNYIFGYVSVDGSNNAWSGNANSTSGIYYAGSNGVFNTTYGSGYEEAYTIVTNQTGDAFFFAQNGQTGTNYGLFEYDPSGNLVAGSPFNISGSTSTTTTNYTGSLNITAATETKAGNTYTYTFDFTNVGTPGAVLAVGDIVPLTLTNDPGTGSPATAATGWQNLTTVKVATVDNTANPTSFTAIGGTTGTANITTTNTNDSAGPVTETFNITKSTETHTGGNNPTYTYTFTINGANTPTILVAGDKVRVNLTNAGGGGGWTGLNNVTLTVINPNSTTNPTSFQATGTVATTDGNGNSSNATGTGSFTLNGATGSGTYPYSITTTTTTPGAVPPGDNVAHGAIDAAGDLWTTSEAGNTIARITQTGATVFTPITTEKQPEFPAIDSSGNAWIAIQATPSQIYVVSPSGGQTILTSATTGAEVTSTFGAAVDGNGNIWFANRDGNYGGQSGTTAAGVNSIFVLNGGTGTTPGTAQTAISPSTNYIPEAQYPATSTSFTKLLDDSLNLAIDPSGNLWITNYLGNSVVELVGAAAPVVTPLSVAAGDNELGEKP